MHSILNSVLFVKQRCVYVKTKVKKVWKSYVNIPENRTPRLSKFWICPHTKLFSNVFDWTWIIINNFVIFHSLKIKSNMFIVKYLATTESNRQWFGFENFLKTIFSDLLHQWLFTHPSYKFSLAVLPYIQLYGHEFSWLP